MESAKQAPATNIGALGKAFAKILRLRRATGGSAAGGVGVAPDDDDSIYKLKKSGNLDGYSAMLSGPAVEKEEDDEKQQINKEAMESLLATLFAGVSAIKAAYAQLQVAQSPYEPEAIQSADQAVVSELKQLSELKQSYIRKQLPAPSSNPQPALAAKIQEQGNLLKTYKITTHKLETDLHHKDTELASLQAQLLDAEKQNRALEAQLHPGRTLAAVDELHLSGLNPTHFLTVLRYTVRSVRSFVKLMMNEMESVGWDIESAAAAAVHPTALRRGPDHSAFALESYVCHMMFSDFQHRDFSLGSLEDLLSWDRRRFFDEFTAVKSVPTARQLLGSPGAEQSPLGKFLRVKYSLLVHPKMEAAFFGDLEQRAVVISGRGFPGSGFFAGFAEMAMRVWVLHCLFFSFSEGDEGSIFQARRGCRFSEVYMESVVAEEEEEERATVGFTVVPGFRVGRTVIQCRVYLSASASASAGVLRGRSRCAD